MENVTTSNSTKLHDEFETVIIWYAAIGICGLIGNSFVIAVTSSRSRLNSSHLMIIWLGCTDLISCLALPLRFIAFYKAMMVSPSLCAVGRCFVVFLVFLNTNSRAAVAIERYKAVQKINRNEHLSDKTVRALIVLCILSSAIFTIPFIWFVMNDSTLCNKLDSLSIFVNTNFIGFIAPSTLIVVSTFILITVLYIKIGILVKKRVGWESNRIPTQQLPNEDSLSEPVRPTEGKAKDDLRRWKKILMNLRQVKDGEEFKRGASDTISSQFADLQLIEDTCLSEIPNDAASSRPSVYMISGASPKSGPPQSGQETVSTCECHFPGPSTSSCLHQIPGIVMEEHDNEKQIKLPARHNTVILPDSDDNRKEEPDIPALNNQYQQNFMIIRRVTRMLFITTLVFFVTYFVSSVVVLVFPYGLGRHICREFILINHVINPVIYSTVNEGFRESSISFVHRIREMIGF